MLDFEQDEVFGIFSRRLELVAMAHLAHSMTVAPNANAPGGVGIRCLGVAGRRGKRGFGHGACSSMRCCMPATGGSRPC